MGQDLDNFIRSMDHVVADSDDAHEIARRTERHLAELVQHQGCLAQAFRESAAEHYQQHVVHVHPQGRYSIVSLVWRPGQATPIHDHRCWCVVGVLQGQEEETRYHLYSGAGAAVLTERGRNTYHPGQVCTLVPPDENIHRVTNTASAGLTISLHIYGADIASLGTSINRIFDEPVVDEPHAEASPVSWRAGT